MTKETKKIVHRQYAKQTIYNEKKKNDEKKM